MAKKSVLRDREIVAALGNAPELLAIADAIAVTQPRLRKRRTLRPLLVLPACVALAALVVLVTSGSSNFAGRALAAIGGGPIIHVVVEARTGAASVDLTSGKTTPLLQRTELWYDQSTSMRHTVTTIFGHVQTDILSTRKGVFTAPGARTLPAPRGGTSIDAALAGFATNYRASLKAGHWTRDGTGQVMGQSVVWLKLLGQLGVPNGERVALNSRTLRPIWVEPLWGGRTIPGTGYAVVSIETTKRGNFALPRTVKPPLYIGIWNKARPVAVAGAISSLHGLVWVGTTFRSGEAVKASTQRLTLARSGERTVAEHIPGVRLEYGRGTTASELVVLEARRPEVISMPGRVSYGWTMNVSPPSGVMIVVTRTPRVAEGRLVRGPFFVTLLGRNLQSLVKAARMLKAAS